MHCTGTSQARHITVTVLLYSTKISCAASDNDEQNETLSGGGRRLKTINDGGGTDHKLGL